MVVLGTLFICISIIYKTQQEEKLANSPVDVLRDWKITVDSSKTYKPGEPVPITSTFKKLVNSKGETVRYFQCYKPGTTDWDSYIQANKNTGTASPTTNGKAIYTAVVPLNLGILPNTCRIYVVTTYNVNKYHPAFQETNYSNTFTVVQREGIVSNESGQTLIYTNNQPSKTYDSTFTPNTSQQSPIVILQTAPSSPSEENSSPTTPKQGIIQNILNKVGL